MKEAFVECMGILYAGIPVGDYQLKAMFQVFAMGYVTALRNAGAETRHQIALEECRVATNEHWVPDSSYKWW